MLICPPLLPPSLRLLLAFPFSPRFFPSDHAAAGGPDGGRARDLPEPHGRHRRRPDAANGRLQRQRAGGRPPHPLFRYDPPPFSSLMSLEVGGLPALTASSRRYEHAPRYQHGARAKHRHADRGERLQPAATADQWAARLGDHLHQRHPPLPR